MQSTRVVEFHPAIPSAAGRAGNCWTDSIAVSRRGAWRCMAGNEIFDPCFENSGLTNAVICGANPAAGKAGFVLKLTEPLPAPSSGAPSFLRPWMVKLADGTTCEILTGTISSVNGLDVPYDCSDSKPCADDGCPYMTGLTPDFKPATVWTAEKVAFRSSGKGTELIKRERLPVEAVWK